jgi:predicted esterase
MALDPAAARTTLVLLHGRGHEAATMEALAVRLALDGLAVVAPEAPERSWYPGRFFEPRAANEPFLTEAGERVDRELDALEAGGVPAGRIVLGGFSQGACLACDVVARRPRPLGGLAVLCGGVIGAGDELAAPPPGSLSGLPVLITATQDDGWVPVERVRDSAARLAAAGAEVDLREFGPGPHGIHDEEVEALRDLVLSLAPHPAPTEEEPWR